MTLEWITDNQSGIYSQTTKLEVSCQVQESRWEAMARWPQRQGIQQTGRVVWGVELWPSSFSIKVTSKTWNRISYLSKRVNNGVGFVYFSKIWQIFYSFMTHSLEKTVNNFNKWMCLFGIYFPCRCVSTPEEFILYLKCLFIYFHILERKRDMCIHTHTHTHREGERERRKRWKSSTCYFIPQMLVSKQN